MTATIRLVLQVSDTRKQVKRREDAIEGSIAKGIPVQSEMSRSRHLGGDVLRSSVVQPQGIVEVQKREKTGPDVGAKPQNGRRGGRQRWRSSVARCHHSRLQVDLARYECKGFAKQGLCGTGCGCFDREEWINKITNRTNEEEHSMAKKKKLVSASLTPDRYTSETGLCHPSSTIHSTISA